MRNLIDGLRRFLSTPSARRATRTTTHHCKQRFISIHALREEGDQLFHRSDDGLYYFYPRPPRGGRPSAKSEGQRRYNISIHALREEGDRCSTN